VSDGDFPISGAKPAMPLNHASDRVASPVGKVFISHASSDEGFVDRLAYDLSRHGVSVWYDKLDLRIGDSIPGKINEGLSACVPRPGSRARGSAAWRPLRQSSARAPCCNDPVLHAATPRTRASATRCRAFRRVEGLYYDYIRSQSAEVRSMLDRSAPMPANWPDERE